MCFFLSFVWEMLLLCFCFRRMHLLLHSHLVGAASLPMRFFILFTFVFFFSTLLLLLLLLLISSPFYFVHSNLWTLFSCSLCYVCMLWFSLDVSFFVIPLDDLFKCPWTWYVSIVCKWVWVCKWVSLCVCEQESAFGRALCVCDLECMDIFAILSMPLCMSSYLRKKLNVHLFSTIPNHFKIFIYMQPYLYMVEPSNTLLKWFLYCFFLSFPPIRSGHHLYYCSFGLNRFVSRNSFLWNRK